MSDRIKQPKSAQPNDSAQNSPLELSLNEFQARCHDTAAYPNRVAFDYLAHGLAGEASEVLEKTLAYFVATGELEPLLFAACISIKAGRIAEHVKKVHRDDRGLMTAPRADAILKELGDLRWYDNELLTQMGVKSEAVSRMVLEKLQSRQKRGKLQGEGDSR